MGDGPGPAIEIRAGVSGHHLRPLPRRIILVNQMTMLEDSMPGSHVSQVGRLRPGAVPACIDGAGASRYVPASRLMGSGMLERRVMMFVLGVAATMLVPAAVEAAPSRVAILGPSDTPILPRLQRNVDSMKLETSQATVSLCTRDVVTRLVDELGTDAAICTDGDQIGVWVRDGERLVLKDAVVVQSSDARAQELAAARAVMALQTLPATDGPPASPPPGSFTIVASGRRATIAASNPEPTTTPTEAPPARDTAAARPRASAERIAPRLVLGAGPAIAGSRDGSSFAISVDAEIGVSRYVALVPWLQVVPANRLAEAPLGTASFRPTIFGLGFGIPLLRPSSIIVPRIGAGYGILWMHVAPETASAPATMRKPEDLLAPMMYASTALSVKVAQDFRVAAEGMFGASSHDMVVRIGGTSAAHWGVPLASAALRGEWVMQ